jgi:hypothetical protein
MRRRTAFCRATARWVAIFCARVGMNQTLRIYGVRT